MSGQVVYVDRFTVREGQLEDFKRYAAEMADFVKSSEPGVVSFNYYLDEAAGKGTALFIFSDAAALDVHLDVASPRFQQGYQLLASADIELLGQPSARAADVARGFNAALKPQAIGFSRERKAVTT